MTEYIPAEYEEAADKRALEVANRTACNEHVRTIDRILAVMDESPDLNMSQLSGASQDIAVLVRDGFQFPDEFRTEKVSEAAKRLRLVRQALMERVRG